MKCWPAWNLSFASNERIFSFHFWKYCGLMIKGQTSLARRSIIVFCRRCMSSDCLLPQFSSFGQAERNPNPFVGFHLFNPFYPSPFCPTKWSFLSLKSILNVRSEERRVG